MPQTVPNRPTKGAVAPIGRQNARAADHGAAGGSFDALQPRGDALLDAVGQRVGRELEFGVGRSHERRPRVVAVLKAALASLQERACAKRSDRRMRAAGGRAIVRPSWRARSSRSAPKRKPGRSSPLSPRCRRPGTCPRATDRAASAAQSLTARLLPANLSRRKRAAESDAATGSAAGIRRKMRANKARFHCSLSPSLPIIASISPS